MFNKHINILIIDVSKRRVHSYDKGFNTEKIVYSDEIKHYNFLMIHYQAQNFQCHTKFMLFYADVMEIHY